MVIELIITLVVGSIFIVLSYQLCNKQRISIIHDYHYKNVKQQDVKAYTRLMGIALLIIGICTILTGIIDCIFNTILGWIIFALGFIAGFVLMNIAQKKYNGSWFS